MEASRKRVTSPFNFWLAVLLFFPLEFPSIFFSSKVIQELHAREMVKQMFQFLGANLSTEFFWQISTPKKDTSL
jgi:hypothetical protein